jgi:hypothetical protein
MYIIIDEPNINKRISHKESYDAHIIVHGKRLERNRTNFTNEELFEISMGWLNMDLIHNWTPETYRKSKLKTNKNYLLIKTLK